MKLYFDTEEELAWTPQDHDHDEEEEEILRKRLLEAERQATESAAAAMKLQQEMEREICSCGHYTCGMIKRYGHPFKVYKPDIKPLPNQSKRDAKALELKGVKP